MFLCRNKKNIIRHVTSTENFGRIKEKQCFSRLTKLKKISRKNKNPDWVEAFWKATHIIWIPSLIWSYAVYTVFTQNFGTL